LRARLRDLVTDLGGTVTPGPPLRGALPHVEEPFANADYVEDSDGVRARPVRPSGHFPAVAFLDGIQRFAVEARFGLVPVIRGHVGAAVLCRRDGHLEVEDAASEDFLVTAAGALNATQRSGLAELGLPLHEVEVAERAHPILDVQRTARVVERRRETLERRLAGNALERDPERWLVVDGSVGDLGGARVLGVIKSHETQFLRGTDLEIALTLPEGHRTSVFARSRGTRGTVWTWYLRMWPWENQDLLHGLVRIERPPLALVVDEVDAVSAWLIAERTPLSAPDARWDRLLYPIHQVETYLRAQLGGWW